MLFTTVNIQANPIKGELILLATKCFYGAFMGSTMALCGYIAKKCLFEKTASTATSKTAIIAGAELGAIVFFLLDPRIMNKYLADWIIKSTMFYCAYLGFFIDTKNEISQTK